MSRPVPLLIGGFDRTAPDGRELPPPRTGLRTAVCDPQALDLGRLAVLVLDGIGACGVERRINDALVPGTST